MSTVADKIRAEIAERGVISFARFMELALYCPDCGFYEKENDTIGRRGDFYTSVSVGPLLGELLAFQFAAWLTEHVAMNPEQTGAAWQVVEAGAHDGRLAQDILNWLRLRQPALFDRIEYWIVEPSARRRKVQRETLTQFTQRVRWVVDLRSLGDDARGANSDPQSAIHNPQSYRVIFANELLDALPVHRWGWDARQGKWFEWGVTAMNDRFAWVRLTKPIYDSGSTIHVPPELLAVLPDGFTTEICPAADRWWREAISLLRHGKILTIDYGLSAEEFFVPERAQGTLRAYHRHRVSDDVLANPGEQDITAHVNLAGIQSAGEAAGLRTEVLQTQERFLTDIAGRAWAEGSSFGTWTSGHTRQFQTLTHPEHLGRAFRVLVQAK